MDHAQIREFPMSLSSQSVSSYSQGPRQQAQGPGQQAQGPRQHVNTSHSQDSMYRLSHSIPSGRQHDNSKDQDDLLHSSNQLKLMERDVSPNYSRFQQEGYHSVQQSSSSHHKVTQSLVTHPDLGGHSHRSQEYSHRNSPVEQAKLSVSSTHRSMPTSSQTSAHKLSFSHVDTSSVNNNQQQQAQKKHEGETEEAFTMSDYQTESQKEAELFFDHKIKKDSEIKLTKRDMEFLAEVEKESQLYRKNGKSEPQKNMTPSSSDSSDSPENKAKMEATAVNQLLNLQSDRTHVCMTCFKTFKNKPQLHQHELVHNGVRKHVCIYCDKAFKQVCHLNQHTRVHTGERPYKCTMEGCERAFAQLSNLNHHMKNHDEHVRREISKQFRCDVCDRSYANQNSLHTHIQKLHMNLKAVEGTTSNPIVSPSPKKRKRKSKDTPPLPDIATLQNITQQYSLEISDSEDEGPSSEVNKKSALILEHESTGKVSLSHTAAKNHSGNETSIHSGISQSRGPLLLERDADQQRFTQIKMEHSVPKALEQPIMSHGKGDLQLSQTYSPDQTSLTKQGKLHGESHATLHREITASSNGRLANNSNQPMNNSLPFVGHSSPNITSLPVPSNLPLPQMSLAKSIADTLPSHMRHHFPEILASSNLERDSRATMQNLFNPAFSHDQGHKSEPNRFR